MKIEAFSAATPYLIRQDYKAYAQDQHEVWAELVNRVLPTLQQHAAQEYLDGHEIIGLEQ
jgi:phenylalanine-4-hydroxylase